jgi:hypothetical protein
VGFVVPGFGSDDGGAAREEIRLLGHKNVTIGLDVVFESL